MPVDFILFALTLVCVALFHRHMLKVALIGVALLSTHFEASNVAAWLHGGWHVALAYVIGYALLLGVHGWAPDPPHRVDSAQRGVAVATRGVLP